LIVIIHWKSKLITAKIAKTLRAKNIVKIMLIVLIALAIVVGLIWWVVKSRMDDADNDY
jgi:flagellar biogenesis protein FliO